MSRCCQTRVTVFYYCIHTRVFISRDPLVYEADGKTAVMVWTTFVVAGTMGNAIYGLYSASLSTYRVILSTLYVPQYPQLSELEQRRVKRTCPRLLFKTVFK